MDANAREVRSQARNVRSGGDLISWVRAAWKIFFCGVLFPGGLLGVGEGKRRCDDLSEWPNLEIEKGKKKE
jgi:hypothetical protein